MQLTRIVISGHLLLCSDDSAEMAKLYGNKSAAFYQLALQAENEEADDDVKAEILQRALDDGLKSVELDSSYEKGHFRLILSTFLLPLINLIVHHVGLLRFWSWQCWFVFFM